MLSFNHYAYGSVVDWLYRHMAGLAPDRDVPGYRHTVFAPRPGGGLEWARASVDSAYGVVSIEWRIRDDELVAEVALPSGTAGTFFPPVDEDSSTTHCGSTVPTREPIALSPGKHRVVIKHPLQAGGASVLRP